jgi:hypothetical protein
MRVTENSLNRSSVLLYLATIIKMDETGQRLVNGMPMDQTRTRAYFRWSIEGSTPDFFSLDRWLTFFDVHIEDYLNFCRAEGFNAWALSEPQWNLV